MKDIQRQDIKIMIDVLTHLEVYPSDEHIVDSAITMLEYLGNLTNKLEYDLDNSKRKSEDLERIIITNTESFANKISELQLENANLKKELDFTRKFVL